MDKKELEKTETIMDNPMVQHAGIKGINLFYFIIGASVTVGLINTMMGGNLLEVIQGIATAFI